MDTIISACLTSWTFHFDAIDFGDVDVASPVVLADIGFGGIEGHGTLEKVFTTEKEIEKCQNEFYCVYCKFVKLK